RSIASDMRPSAKDEAANINRLEQPTGGNRHESSDERKNCMVGRWSGVVAHSCAADRRYLHRYTSQWTGGYCVQDQSFHRQGLADQNIREAGWSGAGPRSAPGGSRTNERFEW